MRPLFPTRPAAPLASRPVCAPRPSGRRRLPWAKIPPASGQKPASPRAAPPQAPSGPEPQRRTRIAGLLRRIAALGLGLALALALACGWAGWLRLRGNFHTVVADTLYRSAQPDAADLARWHQQYGLRSVLNLRGASASGWYRDELAASARLGLVHADFAMKDDEPLDPARARALVALIDSLPKPVLIHCKAGADRTGLASALYLAAHGAPEPRAEAQLSFRFGHVGLPVSAAWAMDQSWERMEPALGYASSRTKPMAMTFDSSAPVRPANQRLRIAVLRLLALPALPLILWGQARWSPGAVAAFQIAGTLLIVAAVLGRFWAILYIGGRKSRAVMRDGPYSICRHPLYLFSTLGAIGFGLLLNSLLLAALFGATTCLVLTMTARREERYLIAQFGSAYRAYRAEVPMLWPAPRRFCGRPEILVSIPVLRRNLADALVFLTALPVAGLINLLHAKGLLLGFWLW